MKKALVIGIGITGKAVIEYLLKNRWEIIAYDNFRNDKTLPCELIKDFEKIEVKQFDQVIISPGISLKHPLVEKALKEGISVIGEAEFAFRKLKNPIIGITGTNGKSTCVLQIAHVLNAFNKKAIALGNIGKPLISVVDEIDPDTIIVAELSSFQLETMKAKVLHIAAILNLSPDHLDRHETMSNYMKEKLKIVKCLKDKGNFFIDDKLIGTYSHLLSDIKSIYPLKHQKAFAIEICKLFGVSEEEFQGAIKTFKNLNHRLQFVGKINGIKCFNDSKATNIDATCHAVRAIKKNIILLAGGRNKGANFASWNECFYHKVKKIILFGEAADRIKSELSETFSIEIVQTLGDAFTKGLQVGKEGDNLVLSPGCSSFDQFVNFEERGNIFIRMVEDESKRYNISCSAH